MVLIDEIRAYRTEHQCSVFAARRAISRQRLLADAVAATTFDELKAIVLRVIERGE